jgi:hypothetical protein
MVVGASTAGDHGLEVGDELTSGIGRTERERACMRKKRRQQTWPTGHRERERGREGARVGVDKPGPRGSERERERGHAGWRRHAGPTCHAPRARGRGRARRGAGLNGLTWAELAFLFSREFLITFLFVFSRVFNSNSNQVSNSNQIKHVQQFKEYLELNMMQHFMTHLFCQK